MLCTRPGRLRGRGRQRLVALLCWAVAVVVASGADIDVTLAVIHRRTPIHLRNCLRTLMGVISDGELSGGGGLGEGESRGGLVFSWELLVVETAPDGHASSKRDALLSTVSDFPPSRPVLNRLADSGSGSNSGGGLSKKSGLNVSQSLRAALAEAGGEIIVWIDDSLEVRPGLLRGMLSSIVGTPSVGIVGAEVLEPGLGPFIPLALKIVAFTHALIHMDA